MYGVPVEVYLKLVQKWSHHLSHNPRKGPPNALSPFDQVLLYITHLRHYIVNCFMGLLFQVSKTTVKETIELMEDFFYDTFAPYVNAGTPEQRAREGFHYFHEVITWVIDGSEQKTHSSRNVYHENEYFSTKKGQHSVTILLIISPITGKILYISTALYGSVKDDEFVRRSCHAWKHLFTTRDGKAEAGLGDLGFRNLQEAGVRLWCPPSNHKTPIYKMLSHYRILVENRIARLKDFAALRNEIRGKIVNNQERLLKSISKKWAIVGGIVNASFDNYKAFLATSL